MDAPLRQLESTSLPVSVNTDLFAKSEIKHNAILLVDASGSVFSQNRFNGVCIFDKMKDIIKTLDEQDFRIIFWNSDQDPRSFFQGGFCRMPFVVKKPTLDQAFEHIKTNLMKNPNGNYLTYPHIGFENIPADWLNPKEPTKIYYITDGEIGYNRIEFRDLENLKQKLSASIRKIFEKYANIQLNIITVEAQNRDYGDMESLQNAAGSDVYKIIVNNRLTQYVTKFISYTPNNLAGFAQINRVIPPPGFIPFGEKYFSGLRVGEFITYLTELIAATPGENELIKIVQNLAGTIAALVKDKPKKIIDDITRTFCSLFAKTVLDPMFVHFILSDAVQKESAGAANVFAAYRAQLKNLYKEATKLLMSNVCHAVGTGEFFMSLPINNKIVSGHYRLIDRNITCAGNTYPQAATIINDILVPILPLDSNGSSLMNDQCVRQWTRTLISRMYGVNVQEDIVIYIVLGLCLRVVASNVDGKIKNAYRRLATIMLKKKRANTDITELERLETGELPIPNNGKMETFYSMMNTVGGILGLKVQPMTLWYALCLAVDNEKMILKQLIHCAEFMEKDFPATEPKNLLTKLVVTPVTYHEIPFESVLDYSCLVTMEDTSNTGGYRFLPHQNMANSTCSPVYVLSNEGYRQLTANANSCVCPICYTHLTVANFAKVNAKPAALNNTIFEAGTHNIFAADARAPAPVMAAMPVPVLASVMDKKGTVVIMKGTVGSGKSSAGMKIKEFVEKMGGYCCVTGTDKYCKTGIDSAVAPSMVQNELRDLNKVDNKMIVAVIDTCGEKASGDNIFGVNFAGWKKVDYWPNLDRGNLEGYLCWSLRNVLQRTIPKANDNHWLNPDGAGVQICVSVHNKKAQALFGNKPQIVKGNAPSKEQLIASLNERADAYLKQLVPIDVAVEKFVKDNIVSP